MKTFMFPARFTFKISEMIPIFYRSLWKVNAFFSSRSDVCKRICPSVKHSNGRKWWGNFYVITIYKCSAVFKLSLTFHLFNILDCIEKFWNKKQENYTQIVNEGF